jgi:hypothetical protein
MEDTPESMESWLQDSQNTEFDKKAKEVIRQPWRKMNKDLI